MLAICPLSPDQLPEPPEVSAGLQPGEDAVAAWSRARQGEADQRQWGMSLVDLVQRAWAATQEINEKGENQ